MEAAAKRIAGAIERGETVAVFGDYDVDGTAASALLHDYFQACGTPCLIHIAYIPGLGVIRAWSRENWYMHNLLREVRNELGNEMLLVVEHL
jgi:hypothetical protein